MSDMSQPSGPSSHHPGWSRGLTGAMSAAIVVMSLHPAGAQQTARINRLIEALDRGQPAITSSVWIFIDQEHGPYVIDQLGARLRDLAETKTASGQQRLAPIVRIPTEGDQNVRWVVKQVLERGAMGIIVPQVENAEQATKIIQAVRYPQRKDTTYPVPPGRRGFAGAPRTWGLSVMEYIQVADVWPLNPKASCSSCR